MPRIEELLFVIGQGKIFSRIDLQNAYLQVSVEEDSQKFLVINTHKGLFRFKRLPFGLASSPAIFQRFMSQTLVGIEGVATYLDDILICGRTKEEHDHRLQLVLQLLRDKNVQINKEKSTLHKEVVEYLGYHISGEGIKPSPRKLKSIMDAPPPTSVAELQSYLGLITYYGKFVRDFASKLAPLYDLLHKGKPFKWTKAEQMAYFFLSSL